MRIQKSELDNRTLATQRDLVCIDWSSAGDLTTTLRDILLCTPETLDFDATSRHTGQSQLGLTSIVYFLSINFGLFGNAMSLVPYCVWNIYMSATCQIFALNNAIQTYHTLFRVPTLHAHCNEAIARYHDSRQVTLAYHTPSVEYHGQEIRTMWSWRNSLTPALRTAVRRNFPDVPKTALSTIDWPTKYKLTTSDKSFLAQMLSIIATRRTKLADRDWPLMDAEPSSILEMDYLLEYFPDLIYMAIDLGPLVSGTNLPYIKSIYVISDTTTLALVN